MKAIVWGTINKSLSSREIRSVRSRLKEIRQDHEQVIFPVVNYSPGLIEQVRSRIIMPETDLIVAGYPACGHEAEAIVDLNNLLFPDNLIARPAGAPLKVHSGDCVIWALGNMMLSSQLAGDRQGHVYKTPFVKGRVEELDLEYNLPPSIISAIDPARNNVLIHFEIGTFNKEMIALLASRAGFRYVINVGHGVAAEQIRELPFGGWDLGEVGEIRRDPFDGKYLEVPYRLISNERPQDSAVNRISDVNEPGLIRVQVIGDVVGAFGVKALERFLEAKRTSRPDLLIVQAENSAVRAVTEEEKGQENGMCRELFAVMQRYMGEKYFATGGNHALEYTIMSALKEDVSPVVAADPLVKNHLALPFNWDLVSDREIKPGVNLFKKAQVLGVNQAWLEDWSNFQIGVKGRRLLVLSLIMNGASVKGEMSAVLRDGQFLASVREKLEAYGRQVDAIFLDAHSETTQEREDLFRAIWSSGRPGKVSAAWCTHQHCQQTRAYLKDGKLFVYDIGGVFVLTNPEYKGWIKFIAGDSDLYEVILSGRTFLTDKAIVSGLEFVFDPAKASIVDYKFIQEVV
ncbi:MAG: hypothetical protein PHH60_06150 [Candidatus Margulisbacteria bacterium]|nr:hypothetical protein [Candidatus Margulisiibacteriota bacterium]